MVHKVNSFQDTRVEGCNYLFCHYLNLARQFSSMSCYSNRTWSMLKSVWLTEISLAHLANMFVGTGLRGSSNQSLPALLLPVTRDATYQAYWQVSVANRACNTEWPPGLDGAHVGCSPAVERWVCSSSLHRFSLHDQTMRPLHLDLTTINSIATSTLLKHVYPCSQNGG